MAVGEHSDGSEARHTMHFTVNTARDTEEALKPILK